jgi:signal transduction histidine kinase
MIDLVFTQIMSVRQLQQLLNLLVHNLADTERGGRPDEQRQKMVTHVEDLLQHMSLIIDDFRDFFRTGQEQMLFDLKESVGKILDLFAADLERHGIETVFDAEDGLYVTGYGNEFSHVLLNLLNNAKEALVDKGSSAPRIHIRLFQEEGKKVITVRDNAGGVPDSIREQLFESHFTTKKTGTGIGLYIAKIIIEKRLHGSISAHNTGDGLELRIEL